jgi:dihydropteroate synthase
MTARTAYDTAVWHCGRFRLAFDRPLVMGIVNATRDSFSDGGRFADRDAALVHARHLISEGADILDVGGESTRPGAAEVPAEEELRRVLPLVEALAAEGVPLSVDTSKPEVMRATLRAGASIINDVQALAAPGALEVIAASDCGIVLMHMQGTPRSMQAAPHYDDVVAEVGRFLVERVDAATRAGIAAPRIVVDPGFGFGKTREHNYALLAHLGALSVRHRPVLAGLSRKRMLSGVREVAPSERLAASVTAAVLAAERGARIVRVHDVGATRDALEILAATQAAS